MELAGGEFSLRDAEERARKRAGEDSGRIEQRKRVGGVQRFSGYRDRDGYDRERAVAGEFLWIVRRAADAREGGDGRRGAVES